MKAGFKFDMGRKGWLRVVEAFSAVMIVMSVIFLQFNSIDPGVRKNVLIAEDAILKEIIMNNTYKGEILSVDLSSGPMSMGGLAVSNYTYTRLPAGVEFRIMVCPIEDRCVTDKKNVYATEMFVAANLSAFSPRKVKLFVWER